MLQLEPIVERIKSGDKKAFPVLVKELTNTVNSLALAITRDVAYSEDVTQQVFIKVWQKIDELKSNSSILPWVRQLTRYTAINHVRDLGMVARRKLDTENVDEMLNQVYDDSHAHDLSLIKEQQSHLISHLLEQLPDESREIVVLYYREDQSTKVVAELLDISEVLVRKRLQRVREHLKEKVLSQYGKVILSSAPLGISSTIAIAAMTASPTAAASIGVAASSQSHWLLKVISILGGAFVGGLIAIFVSNTVAKKAIAKFDNPKDIALLEKNRKAQNLFLVFSTFLLVASYSVSEGWLLPCLAYLVVIFGINRFVSVLYRTNAARIQNQLGLSSTQIEKQLRKEKIGCLMGWCIGAIGGSTGFIMGMYQSGRFETLI
ncbi:RNA polymerase sigma factor [Shewanella sp. 202IG2-18]|uniref:RNA polymerase sigma factor n=1 Tax=Parashewanella hymeniacidonis TaxID=2807618 RepID=UPI00196171BB|nr:RNA polymerase sigma factor [Parashewanella hymeniacidonis]MBM7074380.1 RNA polymerase sigma factor [Parashewanella hymeniacidonis]